MDKRLLICIAIVSILALGGVASAAGTITLDSNAVTGENSGKPGETLTLIVRVNNTHPTQDITANIILSSTDLGDNNEINAPVISSIVGGIDHDSSETQTFTITLPAVPVGDYVGEITATEDGVPSNEDKVNYTVTVLTLDKLTITTPSTTHTHREETTSTTLKLENEGSTSLSSISIEHTLTDFQDSDENQIDLMFLNIPSSLNPGKTADVIINATVDEDIAYGTYSGEVNITSGAPTESFTLRIEVLPKVCKYGECGDLEISDIDSPDEDDEFKPDEEITVEFDVNNEADDDLKVIAEAWLYNIDAGKKEDSVKSSSVKIEEGEDHTFSLKLTVPDDIDESDNYKIYVKAYESGDEDIHCNEDSIEVDIDREDHELTITNIVFDPTEASCSGEVKATFTITNIGSSDEEDILVYIKNSKLGISESLDTFDLDSTKKTTKEITFTVPTTAADGDYSIEIGARYDDGDETKTELTKLTLDRCPGLLSVDSMSNTVNKGDSTTFTLTLRNTGLTSRDYEIKVEDVDDFGSYEIEVDDIENINVEAGEARDVKLIITPDKDAKPGDYDITVKLYGSDLLGEKKLTVTVESVFPWVTGFAVFGDSETQMMLGGIIIALIIVAVFSYLLIKRKGSRKKGKGKEPKESGIAKRFNNWLEEEPMESEVVFEREGKKRGRPKKK